MDGFSQSQILKKPLCVLCARPVRKPRWPPHRSFRATLINLTLTIVALLFFSFFYEKLRKNHIKGALIYSRLNKSALP
jgi:hypothetical protein